MTAVGFPGEGTADYQALSRVTIFRMMAAGDLTRYRVKGRRASLIDRRELRRQLEPRAVTPG